MTDIIFTPPYDSVPLKVDPKEPLQFLQSHRVTWDAAAQKAEFDLIRQLNQISGEQYPSDQALAARIKSYELAYRMQTAVPDGIIRFDTESKKTHELMV